MTETTPTPKAEQEMLDEAFAAGKCTGILEERKIYCTSEEMRERDYEPRIQQFYARLDEIKAQAALSRPAQPVASEERVKVADKALLLAARWFKLNFDDDTLHEHPPSKADLAGMFDAMQEARAILGSKSDGCP